MAAQTITIGAQFTPPLTHQPSSQGGTAYFGATATPPDGFPAPGFDQNDLVAAAGLQNKALTFGTAIGASLTALPQMPFQDVSLFIGAMCAAYSTVAKPIAPNAMGALVMQVIEAMFSQQVSGVN